MKNNDSKKKKEIDNPGKPYVKPALIAHGSLAILADQANAKFALT